MRQRGFNIVQKFILYLVVLSILPLLIVGGISYVLSTRALEQQASRYAQGFLAKEKELLELRFAQIEGVLSNLSAVDEISEAVLLDPDQTDTFDALATQAQIGYILNRYSSVDGLVSIELFSATGLHFRVGDTLQVESISDDVLHDIHNRTMDSGQETHWVGVAENVNQASSYKKVLPAAKILRRVNRETLAFEPVALLIANLSTEFLYTVLSRVDMGEGAFLLLVDQEGQVIYHPDAARIGKPVSDLEGIGPLLQKPPFATRHLESPQGYYYVTAVPIGEGRWSLYSILPEQAMLAQTRLIGSTTLIAVALAIILSSIAGYLVSVNVVRPIRRVTDNFRKLQSGSLEEDLHLPVDGSDEIAELAVWFNTFMTNLEARYAFEAQLKVAKEEAEQANKFKSEFLAHMSHEVRTPLNAIIGFSDLILSRSFGPIENPKYREYLEDIKNSGTHLSRIINDILDLSKIEAGKQIVSPERVSLAFEIDAVLKIMGPRVAENDLAFVVDLPPRLPDLIFDKLALRRVLLNLISNAIKFTPAGGELSIHVKLPEEGGLRMIFRDTGIGIPQAQLHTVLEPFGQVTSSMTKSQEGTGLGLAIVKALVEQHAGTVGIDSVEGAWTAVTLDLPPSCLVQDADDLYTSAAAV
ncbi:MAG: sensor histidine kinase [Magnetospiraceae bacterium]